MCYTRGEGNDVGFSPKKKTQPSAPLGKPRRGRPPTHSRADILNAAKLEFSKSGYANVSLEHLATRLNTRKGTLYYYSARKVDLLISISREMIASAAELRKIAEMKAPATTRFIAAMRFHLSTSLADKLAPKIYFENESHLPPKVRAEMRKILKGIERVFLDIIADGVNEGVFNVEPRLAVKHVMAVATWPYRWYSESGPLNPDQFADNIIQFMLGALAGYKGELPKRGKQ